MRVKDGKGVKHDGIKVEFVGSIGESDHPEGNVVLFAPASLARARRALLLQAEGSI